jgi:hypothetical protein
MCKENRLGVPASVICLVANFPRVNSYERQLPRGLLSQLSGQEFPHRVVQSAVDLPSCK